MCVSNLFLLQNNNRGGYNVGDSGSTASTDETKQYRMVSSVQLNAVDCTIINQWTWFSAQLSKFCNILEHQCYDVAGLLWLRENMRVIHFLSSHYCTACSGWGGGGGGGGGGVRIVHAWLKMDYFHMKMDYFHNCILKDSKNILLKEKIKKITCSLHLEINI